MRGWVQYTPGDKYAGRLVGDDGHSTHSVARIYLKDGWVWEAWRNPDSKQPERIGRNFSTKAAAKAYCEQEANNGAA